MSVRAIPSGLAALSGDVMDSVTVIKADLPALIEPLAHNGTSTLKLKLVA